MSGCAWALTGEPSALPRGNVAKIPNVPPATFVAVRVVSCEFQPVRKLS